MIKHILEKTGISRRHLQYLLAGQRNATPGTARKLERATGIEKSIWIFSTEKQRRAAWEKFKKTQARVKR